MQAEFDCPDDISEKPQTGSKRPSSSMTANKKTKTEEDQIHKKSKNEQSEIIQEKKNNS